MKIEISQENLGTLCVCAIRYCYIRRTYMTSFIQKIVRGHLSELSNETVSVMVEDCEYQRTLGLYGDDQIDKHGWLKWEQSVLDELEKR